MRWASTGSVSPGVESAHRIFELPSILAALMYTVFTRWTLCHQSPVQCFLSFYQERNTRIPLSVNFPGFMTVRSAVAITVRRVSLFCSWITMPSRRRLSIYRPYKRQAILAM